MGSDDLTVRVLIEIRDEVRSLSSDVRGLGAEIRNVRTELGARIDETNARIDGTNARLDRVETRVVESEIRTATAITELVGTVNDVRDLLRDRLDLRDRVERCERDIADLKHRVE